MNQTGLSASTLAARLEALKAYYAALDRLLAPLLTPAPDELVLVVTEPGRVGGDARSAPVGPRSRGAAA